MFFDQLQAQFQRGEVLTQPVVNLARDAPPFGLLRAFQPPQHLPVRFLGPLTLRDFRLQGRLVSDNSAVRSRDLFSSSA